MDTETERHDLRNRFDGGQNMPGHDAAVLQARESGWNKARINAALKFVHDTAGAEFEKNPEIKDVTLADCLRRTDRLVLDTLSPLHSRYYKRTYADDTTAFEACYVVTMTVLSDAGTREGDQVTQLHALRVFLSGEKVETEVLPLPLAFRLHAVARMIERGEAGANALRQVAHDLASNAALLRVSERIACQQLDEAMMVPAFGEGGMLIGRFCTNYPIHEGFLTVTTPDGIRTSGIPRHPMEPMFYEVMTYYGGDIVAGFSDTVELREQLLDWKARNALACEREAGDMFWPGRKLALTAPFDFTSDHAAQLEALLCGERFSETISATSWVRSVCRTRTAAIKREMNALAR